MIGKIYGKHITGRLLNSTLKVAESELHCSEPLNPFRNMLNFQNGMLNVDTRSLVPHGQQFRSTIQVNYKYSSTATCPAFEDFIASVSDDNAARMDLLQEMMGYCLCGHTMYQKCFFLVGHGGNGKSILLKIIEDMVGINNCAHVELAELAEPFHRIHLYGKMVNMAMETKSNVAGAESTFKKIVTGDTITGCLKRKDFISFKPFCKMIFALNEMIVSKDITRGFVRRIIFIDFPVDFVEKPTRRGQRRAIPDIDIKLARELPGIMNWSLSGLDRLKANGRFTKTDDQVKYINDFTQISNPILVFLTELEDQLTGTKLERKALFSHYRKWCIDNETRPMSSRGFFIALRKGADIEEIYVNRERAVHIKEIRNPYEHVDDSGDSEPCE